MKRTWITALPIAASLLIFPSITPAQTLSSETPAVVELTHALDANKLTAGATIQARLTQSVKFANGTKLPAGTWLEATVAQDDMQLDGKVKLALRFTDARMKNGQTTPIKATIVNASTTTESVPNDSDATEVVLPVPPNLNDQADRIDAVGITSGVDLHSNATSQNSGVFVTTTKDDVKLPSGTKMELALTLGM